MFFSFFFFFNFSFKCYKRFDTALAFADANLYCNAGLGLGTNDATLMQLKDRNELGIALRLCRDPR